MIPSAFTYHAPSSVAEAVSLLEQYGDEAKILAGGHSLLPAMKLRLADVGTVVDLGGIPGLRGIRREGDSLVIGAMTRLEIWDTTAWAEYSTAQEESFAELSEEVFPGI